MTTTTLLTLNQGQIPTILNHTFITLISKKKQISIVTDYPSIRLCNVLYKLISKVITNRLKRVLPFVISKVQIAFLLERQITDNIFIAYEILHFLKRKNKGKQGFMLLKLDTSKAYDKV